MLISVESEIFLSPAHTLVNLVNTGGTIFGTPAPGEEDVYDLGVNVLIRTPLLDLPFAFPNDQFPGNYFLHVKPAGSANCFVSGADESLREEIQLSVAPNPFSYLTQIQVTAKSTGNFEFRVSNMM